MKNITFKKKLQFLPWEVSHKQEDITCLSIKPLASSDFLQKIFNHPSVLEAKKLFGSIEQSYEKRMTKVCQSGEQRLQSYKKEKSKKISNMEKALQDNLKIAQDIGAKPRKKAEQKLAKILQSKKPSNSLQSLFQRYQERAARYQLEKEKHREFHIIDAAFEKNHLLRDKGISNLKKETEELEQKVLQETETRRVKELSRFSHLQYKIDNLIQTLQNNPFIEEISLL